MDPHTSSNSAFPSATPNGGFVSGMYMGQVPSQPIFVPQPNTTAQVNGPYAFQHSGGAAAAPAHVTAVSSGNSFQAQPFSVVNIGNSTYNQSFINPCSQHPSAAIPLPYPLVPPQQCSAAVPGVTQPPLYGVPPQTHFPAQNTQHHGTGPISTFSVPSPATAPSTGRRRGAGGRKAYEQEKMIRQFLQISMDADFKQMGERDERGNEKFKCLRTGCEKIIVPASYAQHVLTASHRGDTKGACICPMCGKALSRRDSVKRHRKACERLLARQTVLPADFNTSQGSTSSSSMTVPTAPFISPEPTMVDGMPNAALDVGNMQIPPSADAELQLSNTSIYMDPSPPLPEYSEFPETTVAVAPDHASFLASLHLQPEALAWVNTMISNSTSNEGLDKLLNCLNAVLPNATSDVGNVKMPPSADEVTQHLDT